MVRKKCEMTTEYGLKEPKLATKKSEVTDSNANALEAILTKLGAMEDRISTMENKSSEPPKLRMTEDRGDPYKDQRVVQDSLFSEAPTLLTEGDIVRLKEDTEKANVIMSNLDKLGEDVVQQIKDKGILGRVEDYKLTNARNADPKFRVTFPGIGQDGVHMSEIEVIERV